MKCYIMNRTGTFQVNQPSNNQCKEPNHWRYKYICTVVFSPAAGLDKNGFLIDHVEIDGAIQACTLSGSCEQMHRNILRAVRDVLHKKHCRINAIKIVILPDGAASTAKLTYIWTLSDRYVQLLNT